MIKLLQRFRQQLWINYFIVFTRFLIGFAFIPSGLTKVYGERFTTLSLSDPVGFFFESMYRTGIYWNFLGIMQILAALLLFTQRFATIGALLFLVIITNIFLITVGVGFTGTPFITGLMWLATIILIAWDWERISLLFRKDGKIEEYIAPDRISGIWTRYGSGLFVVLLVMTMFPHFIKQTSMPLYIIFAIIAVGISFLITLYIDFKRQKNR